MVALEPLLTAAEARLLLLLIELLDTLEHPLPVLRIGRGAGVYAGFQYRQSRK
jgi:hypothetical protein